MITQDSSGNHRLSYGSKFRFRTDVEEAVLSGAPAARDYLGAIYCEADDAFDVVAFVRGY